MYMQFFLPMQPPTTTHNAKQLHAYMKGGQPHAVLHDSPELKQTRAKLHAHLAPHAPEKPIPAGRPVRLLVKWCFPAEGRKNGSWRTAKPDTDNLEKALKDEMTRLHFWADDAQVCSEIVEKFWSDPCGVFVQLAEHLHDLGPDGVADGRLRLSGTAGLVDAFHTAGQSLSVAAAARHRGKALGGVGGVGLQRGQLVKFEQLKPLGRPVPPEPCLFLFVSQIGCSFLWRVWRIGSYF